MIISASGRKDGWDLEPSKSYSRWFSSESNRVEVSLEFRGIPREPAVMGSFLEGVYKISRAELETHGPIALLS